MPRQAVQEAFSMLGLIIQGGIFLICFFDLSGQDLTKERKVRRATLTKIIFSARDGKSVPKSF